MHFGRPSEHRPFTLGRKPLDREPSFLEVLYPPKQVETKTYRPAFSPPAEKLSESEKFYRTMNAIFKGIGFLILAPFVVVVLAILIALAG